jgi:hypothetical protein
MSSLDEINIVRIVWLKKRRHSPPPCGTRSRRCAHLPEVKLQSGETHADAVERLRKQIVALRVERQKVSNAPPPRAATKKLLRQHVADLATKGRPQINVMRERVEAVFSDPNAHFGVTPGFVQT